MISVKAVTTTRDKVHPVLGHMRVFDVSMIDEATGQALTNAEILSNFRKLNITGVCVKIRADKLFKADASLWPGFGVISEITDTSVYLGNYEVPKQDFLDWYELD